MEIRQYWRDVAKIGNERENNSVVIMDSFPVTGILTETTIDDLLSLAKVIKGSSSSGEQLKVNGNAPVILTIYWPQFQTDHRQYFRNPTSRELLVFLLVY